MITHTIERTLAEITTGKNAKRLCLISWNGNPAKLDLRIWIDGENPGRGLTLTDEEAKILFDALAQYFG